MHSSISQRKNDKNILHNIWKIKCVTKHNIYKIIHKIRIFSVCSVKRRFKRVITGLNCISVNIKKLHTFVYLQSIFVYLFVSWNHHPQDEVGIHLIITLCRDKTQFGAIFLCDRVLNGIIALVWCKLDIIDTYWQHCHDICFCRKCWQEKDVINP